MIIAREKKKSNISEYILYMWQIEDVIRSHYFSIDAINESVINRFDVPVHVRLEMKKWYENLISDMQQEGITEKGHLSYLNSEVDELNHLHTRLLTVLQDDKYQDLHQQARRNIDELIKKSGNTITNDVEACLTGLYGLLVLKLKSAEISSETAAAMRTFSALLAYLSQQYQLHKQGKLALSEERKN